MLRLKNLICDPDTGELNEQGQAFMLVLQEEGLVDVEEKEGRLVYVQTDKMELSESIEILETLAKEWFADSLKSTPNLKPSAQFKH